MAVTNSSQRIFQVLLVTLMVPALYGLAREACHSLSVELYKWTSNGRDHKGSKCDINFPGINPPCDTLFYICVDNKIPQDGTYANRWDSSDDMRSCDYSLGTRRTKEYHNKNSVTFETGPNALGRGFANPMVFKTIIRRWKKARLYVKIEDEDVGGDDPISEHIIDLNGLNLDNTGNKWAYPFNTSYLESNWVQKVSRSANYRITASEMTVNYKAVCCEDYYDYDCDVHCIAQNSAAYGFYTCHPLSGDKVCRRGYIDPSTDPPCVKRYDPCASFICYNGGTHLPMPHELRCECTCPPGVTGHRCQTKIEDTGCPRPNPCQNGGVCEDTDDGYRCVCPPFVTGDNCQLTVCEMDAVTCLNGGVCVEELQGCKCPEPFAGLDCSYCDCSGHGVCDEDAGKCKCNPGWTGDSCNVQICQFKKCLNGGKCINGVCNCKEGFTGEFCEFEIGACDSFPCLNGATCNPLKDNSYKCECAVLFVGRHCEKELPKNNSLKEDPNYRDPTQVVEKGGGDDGLPIWVIVIIVIAALILIIILLLALLWRQKRKRKHAEAQTEHAMRNGGMKNFDNPLYGNENRGAQTQTDVNGVAVGTQANHYDSPKSKKGIFSIFGAKNKGIDDNENPYDEVGARANHYDVPPSSKGAKPPPLPKRSTKREGGQFDNPTYAADSEGDGKRSRRNKPPAYLSGAPGYDGGPPSPIKVVPVDYVEPASPDDDEDDPAKLKKKMAAKYSRA